MRLNRCAAWMLVFGFANGALAQPAAWGLPQLMRGLAQVRSASANFTERKTLRVLSAPLVASGTLTYVAPDRIVKTTATPVAEKFVLDGGVVTISGPDGQAQRFALARDPRIGGLTEGIRGTLAGDLPALERVYSVRLSGTAADWRLVLRPRDAAVARFVQWMVIQGSGDRIEAIDTANSDGDHSEMGVNEIVNDAG